MVTDLNSVFSTTAKGMKRSAIRELLKLTQRSDIISFAGGLPSPDSFPIDQLKEISCEVLDTEGAQASMEQPKAMPVCAKYLLSVTKTKGLSLA